MSLLLDALRKSEKKRSGGSPPPLGLPTGPAAGEAAPARRRRAGRRGLFARVLLALILLALVVTSAWWAAGRPGGSELRATWEAWTGSPDPDAGPGSGAASIDGSATGPASDGGNVDAMLDEGNSESDEPEHRLVAPAYRRPAATASGEPAAGDTAVDTLDDAQADRGRAAEAPTQTMDENPGRTGAATTDRAADSAVEPALEPAPEPVVETGVEPDLEPAADPTADSTADPTPPVPERPTEPATRDDSILPWELPAGLRSEFPGIDVSVHVYAPEAEDRFVLIDGERYGEGDALARGVQLEEIRPRGIVVGYRNYRIRIE